MLTHGVPEWATPGWGRPVAQRGPALQPAAGGEPRNYANYSPASAVVASAATPWRARPRPGRAWEPPCPLPRAAAAARPEPARPRGGGPRPISPSCRSARGRLITGPRRALAALSSPAPSRAPIHSPAGPTRVGIAAPWPAKPSGHARRRFPGAACRFIRSCLAS